MKRFALGFTLVLAAVFVGLSLFRKEAGDTGSQPEPTPLSAAEKEKIRRFWDVYREATGHRVAGRTRESADGYARALELNPEHEDALYYLGNMHFELGEFIPAEAAWRRLAEVNPQSARAHSQLGVLYSCLDRRELVDLERAESEFQIALSINKEETGPLLSLGQIALIRGDLAAAAAYLDAVTGSNYSSVEAHFLRGYIAWKQGERQGAFAAFAEAVRHARPVEPVEGVLGEGDTRAGSTPLLDTSSRCRPLRKYVADLERVKDGGEAQALMSRYREFDQFLEEIREK